MAEMQRLHREVEALRKDRDRIHLDASRLAQSLGRLHKVFTSAILFLLYFLVQTALGMMKQELVGKTKELNGSRATNSKLKQDNAALHSDATKLALELRKALSRPPQQQAAAEGKALSGAPSEESLREIQMLKRQVWASKSTHTPSPQLSFTTTRLPRTAPFCFCCSSHAAIFHALVFSSSKGLRPISSYARPRHGWKKRLRL